MLITRVYTGSDRQSRFEDMEVELTDNGSLGSISRLWSAKGVLFRRVNGDYDLDFYNAPRRQFVVNLTGSVEIEVGDGTKRQSGVGSILFAEDTEGKGYISRSINGESRECLFISLAD